MEPSLRAQIVVVVTGVLLLAIATAFALGPRSTLPPTGDCEAMLERLARR